MLLTGVPVKQPDIEGVGVASKQDWEYWHRLAKANAKLPSLHSPAPRPIDEAMNAVSEMRQRMGGLREVLTPQYRGDWDEHLRCIAAFRRRKAKLEAATARDC